MDEFVCIWCLVRFPFVCSTVFCVCAHHKTQRPHSQIMLLTLSKQLDIIEIADMLKSCLY